MARLRALRVALADTGAPHKQADVKSDINVTPLVDVVLVLLIIFMVVTPLIASGVAVDLPRTANHLRKPDDGKDIIVSVTQDGRVYVGSRQVPRVEDLGDVVVAEQRRFPEKSVFLKGDGRVRFGTIRKVVANLRRASVSDLVMGTEELSKP